LVCDSTARVGFGFLIRGSVWWSGRWIDRGLACVVCVWSVGRLGPTVSCGCGSVRARARSVCDDHRSVAKYKSTYYMRARALQMKGIMARHRAGYRRGKVWRYHLAVATARGYRLAKVQNANARAARTSGHKAANADHSMSSPR
jgi:hypothetical protein